MRRKAIQVDGILDIECSNWTEFVCGGFLHADGEFSVYSLAEDPHAEEKFVWLLLAQRGYIWAHAGGLYDYKWLLDWIVKLGIEAEVICAGSRIIQITIPESGLAFRDSWALVPMSLAKFTTSQGVAKQELNLPCICGDACGGYCAISVDLAPRERARLHQYLEADCRSLFEGLETLGNFAEENDLDLKVTIGSSAWANAARTGGVSKASDAVRAMHSSLRLAYFGGRVEVYDFARVARVREYDVNSAYPWALTQPLPVGKAKLVYAAEARRAFDKREPGFYDCAVDQSDQFIPRLPMRMGDRICYPADTVRGLFALAELDEMADRVVSVCAAIVFETEAPILAPWVERLFALRQVAGGKTPIGQWLKLYLNSLSGKLGMRSFSTKIDIHPKVIQTCKRMSGCFPFCNGECGAHFEISDHVYGRMEHSLADCSHVEWAATLTARARSLLWASQTENASGADLVYSDTDSVIVSGRRWLNVGNELGQLKEEGELRDFQAFAPKVYRATRLDGTAKLRAKGVGIKATDKELRLGEQYTNTRGVIGAKLGARTGRFFTRKAVTRTLARNPGGRQILPSGKTRPMRIAELRKRFEQ